MRAYLKLKCCHSKENAAFSALYFLLYPQAKIIHRLRPMMSLCLFI